jgi:hypothetical protein
MKVYWFDDGPDGGCRIPAGWQLFYSRNDQWIPVDNMSPYAITKDAYDTLSFAPVVTDGLRLEVLLQKDFSAGVHEWAIGL